MGLSTDLTVTSLIYNSMAGVVRGVMVNMLVYPLEVIKTHQQFQLNNLRPHRIAMNLFRAGGVRAFYTGLQPQLVKSSIKQIWCWPMMTHFPVFLERYQMQSSYQQAFTGLAIATIDAAVTTPLERTRIVSITREKRLTLFEMLGEGWKGFGPYWAKVSVYWSTFLVSQKYFRDQCRERNHHPAITFSQLLGIGVKVAVVVSLPFAPLDVINTLKQSQSQPEPFFLRNNIHKLFRGWPLSAVSLIIHNVASITLLEKLGQVRA